MCGEPERATFAIVYGSFRFGSNCVAFVVDVKTSILSYVVGNVATMVLMSETKLSEMHLAGPGHPYSSLLLCVIFLVKFLIWGGKWLVWWGLFCNGNKKVAAFRMLWRLVFRAFWKWNVFVCVDQSLWRGNTDFKCIFVVRFSMFRFSSTFILSLFSFFHSDFWWSAINETYAKTLDATRCGTRVYVLSGSSAILASI